MLRLFYLKQNFSNKEVIIYGSGYENLPAGTDADLAKGKIPHTLPDGVTNRAVYQDILQIALPASVELILSSFTSMADLIMVGNLGTWAITAVGLTTQPKFILMTMVMAMNVGSTALVAQSRGSGNREAAQKYARQAMLLNLTLSILLSVVGFVTARPLVLFMGAKDGHILSAGTAYLQIQMAGFVFFSLTSTITELLRGEVGAFIDEMLNERPYQRKAVIFI